MGVSRMNWRHRVQEILTGKKSDAVYPFLNDELEKIINKCKYKYSGFKDIKKVSMNPFKIIKRYKVGNSIYKIETIMFRKACGFTDNEKERRQAIKLYYKQHIYNSYDKIPNHLENAICYRSTKDESRFSKKSFRSKTIEGYKDLNAKWVVWEYIEGGK